MEKIVMGSIYHAGTAQIPGFDCDGSADISFGDTVPGQELQWVKLQSGLLIADRCVCTNISWDQLNEKGFIFGVPITIDGKTYLCRSLCVGIKGNKPNEWDFALDEVGEDNAFWHWGNIYFWGQEISRYETSCREIRGSYSARGWSYGEATDQHMYVGFRPALEYLDSGPCSPDTLLGKKAKAYCSDGVTIEGYLVDFSDYDITLEANPLTSADCPRITKEGRNIIVSRENIIWLKEE